jgi:hypothetical protein
MPTHNNNNQIFTVDGVRGIRDSLSNLLFRANLAQIIDVIIGIPMTANRS